MEKLSQQSSLSGGNSGGGEEGYDVEFEKKLVRKLDRHIIPVIMLLYLFSFLDRYWTAPYYDCC